MRFFLLPPYGGEREKLPRLLSVDLEHMIFNTTLSCSMKACNTTTFLQHEGLQHKYVSLFTRLCWTLLSTKIGKVTLMRPIHGNL